MRFIFSILFVVIFKNIFSQEYSYKFKRYSLEDGLSQSSGQCFTQDKKGFIWIGTQGGLNRFDGYNFKVYKHDLEENNTISNSFIRSLFCDSYGFLWVGTEEGLNKLNLIDGTIEYFFYHPDHKTTISNNQVRAFYEDKNKNIWIGTFGGGLNKYERKTNNFIRFNSDTTKGNAISNPSIYAMQADSFGNLWIGTYDGLNKFDTTSKLFTHFRHTPSNKNSISGKIVYSVFIDNQNQIWVGIRNSGIDVYNQKTKKFINYPQRKKDNCETCIPGTISTSFVYDAKNKIWISTIGGGLNKFENNTFKTFISSPYNNNSISANSIWSLFSDDFGSIWIGGDSGGICKFDYSVNKFNHFFIETTNDLKAVNNNIWSIFEDSKNNIWIGTDDGLFKYIKDTKKTISYKLQDDNLNQEIGSNIKSIFEDSDGVIWIGTTNNLITIDEKSGKKTIYSFSKDKRQLSNRRIYSIKEDKNHNIWIATYGGGINKFERKSQTFKWYLHNKNDESTISCNSATTLFIDSKGYIWVGTTIGLNRFDPVSEKFTRFYHNPKNQNSLSSNKILSINEDIFGDIWIGTESFGLNKLSVTSNKFYHWTEKDGMPNNTVYGILIDKKGFIWISTIYGISQFNPITKIFKNYDLKDGLQSNEFNANACFQNKNGLFYFGGVNGFNVFNPDSIKKNQIKPKIVLTNFKIFNSDVMPFIPKNKEDSIFFNKYKNSKSVFLHNKKYYLTKNISYTDTIEISYQEQVFTFEFAALHYSIPEKNQYAYKLDNFDNDWNYIGNRRFVTYTNLNAGEYTFRVIASNCDGMWNTEGIKVLLIVTPPFWTTWWFKILIFIIIVVIVFSFIKLREKGLQIQKEILQKKVLERTESLYKQAIEIAAQRDEIELQRDEIKNKNKTLEEAYSMIEEKNKSFTDSVKYAKRIQDAILPDISLVNKLLPQSFVIYIPKSIISGDIYWIEKKQEKIIFAAVDCTGHGVPGALMSVVANNLLYKAINEKLLCKPSDILYQMNLDMNKSLHHSEEEYGIVTDGMDIALCCLNTSSLKLEYAGVNNPLLIIRNNEIEIYKANKYPTGIFVGAKPAPFFNYEIQLNTGDMLYIFSDGFIDQFGGDKYRKFLSNRFKELLFSIHHLPVNEQKEKLTETYKIWKGNYEQADDILIMGVKI